MGDAREALVALLWEKFGVWPNGPLAAWLTEADCARFADAILAEFDVTPSGERDDSDAHDHKWQRRQNVTSRGYRMTPYEVCVADGCDAARQVDEPAPATEHPCGDYPAPCNCDDPETHDGAVTATERDELRAEVERLREDYQAACEARMMFHDELDEAQRQVADLRAGIIAAVTALNREFYRRPVTWIERLAKDLRALLAGSGEQPGEAESRTRAGFRYCRECRVRVDDEHGHDRPAPVVPDSTDVRGELLHVLDSHGIDTYIDGTGAEVGVQNLITDILAVVGQGVAEEIERLRDALTDDPDRAALELIVEDAARIARGEGS